MNKKGQINEKINKIMIVLISIIVLFSLYNGLVPEAQSAGDQFSDSKRCSDAGGSFNET